MSFEVYVMTDGTTTETVRGNGDTKHSDTPPTFFAEERGERLLLDIQKLKRYKTKKNMKEKIGTTGGHLLRVCDYCTDKSFQPGSFSRDRTVGSRAGTKLVR